VFCVHMAFFLWFEVGFSRWLRCLAVCSPQSRLFVRRPIFSFQLKRFVRAKAACLRFSMDSVSAASVLHWLVLALSVLSVLEKRPFD